MQGIGIDFGTTNSALARATPGRVQVARFELYGEPLDVFRSILFFEAERELVDFKPPAWVGPEAIEHYIESGADGRLMQSMKSFLGSRHLKSTSVFGQNMALEELVATVVRGLWDAGAGQLRQGERPPIVAGRPVHFAYAQGEEGDAFAQGRLEEAFRLAGFEDVIFVMEPVAAAFHYESGLDHDELVLVADFGGGTTDFCLLEVGPSRRGRPDHERIVGTAGVAVAGDDFDSRIIENVVAPALGKGVQYRSRFGKAMDLPAWIFSRLQRWNELSVLKSQRTMESLDRYAMTATEPERIRALIRVIDEDLGYALFQSVERAKVELSEADQTTFEFHSGGVHLQKPIRRADFESWIAPDVTRIEQTLDDLLARTGAAASDVDSVFLTGGTARVPAVGRLFAERFGQDRVRTGDFLASVASGLAVRALERAGA